MCALAPPSWLQVREERVEGHLAAGLQVQKACVAGGDDLATPVDQDPVLGANHVR
jgi:hypothetical protein